MGFHSPSIFRLQHSGGFEGKQQIATKPQLNFAATMSEGLSEKAILGAQMTKEFLGEELLTELRKHAVSFTLGGVPKDDLGRPLTSILFFRKTTSSPRQVKNILRKFVSPATRAQVSGSASALS